MTTKLELADEGRKVTLHGITIDLPLEIDDWSYKAGRAFSAFVAAGGGIAASIHAEQLLVELAGQKTANRIVAKFSKASDAHEAVMAILETYGQSGE